VTGEVSLPEGAEMVMPGDNVQLKVKLIAPIAMNEGLRFAIREGGRTVGAGVVAKIIKYLPQQWLGLYLSGAGASTNFSQVTRVEETKKVVWPTRQVKLLQTDWRCFCISCW
jgi:hypothetical protein